MTKLDFSAPQYLGRQLHTADTFKPRSAPLELSFDAVIIGAGPGGLTTATALTEAGWKVAVFEGGRFWTSDKFKRKQSWALEHLYQARGQRLLTGNTLISLQSGRGVGGGTLVNSAITFRAPDRVLEQWIEEQGIDFWEKDSREKLYPQVEAVIGAKPTDPSIAGQNSEVAKRGFEAMGMEAAYMPRSAPGCVGCGTCQTGCPSRGKASADNTWLPRMLRAGGEVYADTLVEEILLEGGRAVGIRAVMRSPMDRKPIVEIKAKAPRVILAAGAVNTPLLLQKQNLANSSGMVGKNLHCHPGVGAIAKFREDIMIWKGATQGFYGHHPEDPEILLETFSASPDIFVAQAGSVGMEAMQFIKDLRKIAACGLLIRDHSSGSVTYNEGSAPSFSYNMLPSDQRKLTMGLLKIAEMFFAAGAQAVRPMLAGGGFYYSQNEAFDFIRQATDPMGMQLYASHPMGTCRLGQDPKHNVVRPQDGRTHDVEGLYITDSSLFPTALGVNPQVTIMAQSLALAARMMQAS